MPREALRTVHFYLFQENHNFFPAKGNGLLYRRSMNCEATVSYKYLQRELYAAFLCEDVLFSAMVCRGYGLQLYVFYRKGNIHLPTCGPFLTYLWTTLVRFFFSMFTHHTQKNPHRFRVFEIKVTATLFTDWNGFHVVSVCLIL